MSSKTVLIADDDRDLVDLLARRCRALGLAVETAGDAITALRKIDQSPPNVAILDVNMPAGNGLSVREMMADTERLSAIPVIILTGKSDEQTIRRCHNLSAYYVPKSPDVWSRVEPLLRELLCLNETVDDCQSVAVRQVALPQPTLSAVDAVFAMVGWDESYLDAPGRAAQERQQIEGPWVLCIDDDAELSHTLKLRLEKIGVHVLRAYAGMEGYQYACATPAQAIILDYEMPDGNGDYVLRRLKDNPLTRDIPVIVLTGRKDKALERKMLNLGAAAFLTKPCAWNTLHSKLGRFLESQSQCVEQLSP
jgi:DNA-binding response OmpR family regulator